MKEKYFKIIDNNFEKDESKKLFKEQINNFYNYKEVNHNNYKIGDIVFLYENHYIHGTRINPKEIYKIKETGLIAPEFYKDIDKNKKKPWVVEFWDVEEKTSLKEYLDKRCGVTIDFNKMDGNVKHVICPINEIEKYVKEEKYRDFIIYQNQEQRFLPNKYNNNNSTMAFIIKNDNINKSTIIKNDIFNKEFKREILEEILPSWYIEKYIDGSYDHHETGREIAIIFGIPANFIEGILVNKDIEQNQEQLQIIKNIFNDCYICNVDGKVIL